MAASLSSTRRRLSRKLAQSHLTRLFSSIQGVAVDNKAELLSGQPGLEAPLPGLPKLLLADEQPKPATQLTTLPSGLRVASEETYGQTTSLSIFVDAGSRYETETTRGASHLLEHLAFTSTASRSSVEMTRQLEDIGAVKITQCGREHMAFTVDVLRTHTERAMELLADTIVSPALVPQELEQLKTVMGWQLEDMAAEPASLITERMHGPAFSPQSPLGRGLHCPPSAFPTLGAGAVGEFRARYFTAPRVVVAGAGVDHSRLVGLAQKYFAGLPSEGGSDERPLAEQDNYVGGDYRETAPSDPFTHVAIAFKAPGWNDPDLIPLCVLQMMLGGGGSFSAGGPGKGMYSRLYTNVLNRQHWIESAVAFNSVFSHTGMFGIQGTALPQNAHHLLDVLSAEYIRLLAQPIGEEELARARNQLKGSVFYNLEMRQILAEDIGRQVLTYGFREEPASLVAKIESVTTDDIRRVVSNSLDAPLTLGAYGDVTALPPYDFVCKRFQR